MKPLDKYILEDQRIQDIWKFVTILESNLNEKWGVVPGLDVFASYAYDRFKKYIKTETNKSITFKYGDHDLFLPELTINFVSQPGDAFADANFNGKNNASIIIHASKSVIPSEFVGLIVHELTHIYNENESSLHAIGNPNKRSMLKRMASVNYDLFLSTKNRNGTPKDRLQKFVGTLLYLTNKDEVNSFVAEIISSFDYEGIRNIHQATDKLRKYWYWDTLDYIESQLVDILKNEERCKKFCIEYKEYIKTNKSPQKIVNELLNSIKDIKHRLVTKLGKMIADRL